MLGTTGGQDRASVFCHPSWVHACNRMARLNESSVAPGQIGTFEFPITAPGGAGTYNESFGVVVNGSGYFQSYNTFQFTVEPERNTAQPVWQSVFTDSTKATSLGWNATLRVGQSAYAVVQMRNTGNTTWTRTGSSFDAMLGTVNGQDRTSGFCGNTWLFPCKRPARLNESSVAPGQIGTFEFPISAPGEPGVYSESFGVVINGKGYFPNGYNTFQFTVEPERNTAQPVWQSVFTDSTKATSLGWNATLAPGQSAFVVILAKNTGNLSWTKSGGTNDTMLGTVLSQDRQSLFCTIGWLHPCNRPVGLKESTIAPGQTGTFEFAVTAPTTRGIYNENFGFVVNGKGYFSSGSVNVQFTIN